MATEEFLPLIVGLPGTTLSEAEQQVLERVRPAGVILFSRNIETADGTRELVRQIRRLEPEPFVSIDLEGGLVNRLGPVWGELPRPADAVDAGRAAVVALGEAAGAACRALGVQLDLAPGVDLAVEGGNLARERRALGAEVDAVVEMATAFHDGLQAWGVGGCLKHFPGIGAAVPDTHLDLPVLGHDQEEAQRHVEPFQRLSERIPVVMVGHVVVPALGDDERPASLSPQLLKIAAGLPGSPVLITDDLEMGAVSERGELPDLVFRALVAGNHGALVCHSFDRLEEIADRVEAGMTEESNTMSRLLKNVARIGTLRRDLCRTFASVPVPDDDTVAQLWETAREAVR